MLWTAVNQTWEPFVLVVGLLLVGHVASTDGIFTFAGARLARLPGGNVVLFASMMLLTAVVTATLNLDTSVVFLTPVLLHAARNRSVDETAFLYGSILMANAASLLLLGSNLTNVLVFSQSGVHGFEFAQTMFLPWLGAVVITTVIVAVWQWPALSSGGRVTRIEQPRLDFGAGLLGVIAVTVLMVALSHPAIPVIVVAIVVSVIDGIRRRSGTIRELIRSANLPVVIGLFVLATSVSLVSRHWHTSQHLLAGADSWRTAGIAAVASNVMNNLPAAALLAAHPPLHPYSLLLGLNLGPNLSVVGALSSVLWMKVARNEKATPSPWRFSKIGVVVTAGTLVVGLVTLGGVH